MNHKHVHIICPFNFCSCVCCVCNSYFGCRCKCHKLNDKIAINDISNKNFDNISNKTPLPSYSNRIFYNKERFQKDNGNYNNSPHNYNNKSNNNDNCKLNKVTENLNNNKYSNYHSRSLSELNPIESITEKKNLAERDRYFNKSNMIDFYKNNNDYYNPSSERESIYGRKKFNDKDNIIMKIRGDRSEEKAIRKKDGDFLGFDYPQIKTIDIKKNDYEDFNKRYLNNDYHKKNKDKNFFNSAENKDKSLDNINNRKRKDVYIQLDLEPHSKNQKYKQSFDYLSNNDFNYNQDNVNDDVEKDKITNNIGLYKNYNQHRYKYLRQIDYANKKKNNIINKYNNMNNNKKLKENDNSDLSKDLNYNYNYNYDNNLGKKNIELYEKYKNDKKKNYLKINSFSFSITIFNNNKINSLIDKDEINYLKKQLLEKNNEILDYKIKIDLLTKELAYYKNQKTKKNKNGSIDNKKQENNFIYRRKSKDEIKINSNESNRTSKNNKMNNNYLKNKINEEYNLKFNNDAKNEVNVNNKNNKNEKQNGLSHKLNVKTDLNLSKDNEYILSSLNKTNLSDKCIYAISSLTKSKSILCFDYLNKSFSFRDYADFGDFQENYLSSFDNNNEYSNNNNSIYLIIKYNYYIVTGENCDMLYVYNSLKRTINKLCSLKNNHSNGALINYSDEIICISGNFNKKVEMYNQSKNEWINLPELKIERSKFATCIIKNKYIFCLFGYNLPTKQYLNSIEYLNIENYQNTSWEYLKYKNENLLSLYIIGAIGINYNDEKIIIVGGNNGIEDKPNEYFYQIIISENFENDKKSYVEETKRKAKDIIKNKCYLFNKGYNIFSYNKNSFYMAFDDNFRAHVFQTNNMAHDIFYFD